MYDNLTVRSVNHPTKLLLSCAPPCCNTQSGGKDPSWDLRAYKAVSDAIAPLYKVYPGSYQNEVSSAEGFNRILDWQQRFWGDNAARLLAVKRQVDLQSRMVVPYGVGWSEGA
jgi:hypothetical protein